MRVELGNTAPLNGNGKPADIGGAPSVTYVTVPDEYSFDENVNIPELQRHLYRTTSSGVTHRENDEALLAIVHSSGVWSRHSASDGPSWVHCPDNPAFEKVLAAFYECPAGKPADVEDTHFTKHGPPGTSLPLLPPEMTALLTDAGRNALDASFLGGNVGETNTSTAIGASSITRSGASWTSNQWAGMVVVTGGAYGVILSNSGTVATIDRWYNVASPGGAAASTPSTGVYLIMPGGAFAAFMGLSNTNITPAITDTTMTGEITTSGGGLIRKIATWAHTSGATTTTLTGVFTANSSDTLPVTIYAMNINTSLLTGSAVTMVYETTISTSATLSAIGDQLTVTETVTSA
jgi:hypothetical protein